MNGDECFLSFPAAGLKDVAENGLARDSLSIERYVQK